MRRLLPVWHLLPAFRAVAETEHLPTAGRLLELSPSALSRSIKQLEESLQTPLFDRVGRQLRLNEHGRAFLGVLREAMRRIDDGVAQIDSPMASGLSPVAGSSLFQAILAGPLDAALRGAASNLALSWRNQSGDLATEHLTSGRIDAVFAAEPCPDSRVQSSKVGALKLSVWIDNHGSLRRRYVGPEAFAARAADSTSSGTLPLYTEDMHTISTAIAGGGVVTVWPDVVSARFAGMRIGTEVAPLEAWIWHRPTLQGAGRAETLITAAKAVFERVERPAAVIAS